VAALVADLNRLYHQSPELHRYEFDWQGFEWIDCHDSEQSVFSFIRKSDDSQFVVLVNFTPMVRYGYRVGLPHGGAWREILNSDSEYYGGSNTGNGLAPLYAEEIPWMDRPCSLALTLPPLAAIILRPER
jgi:1,4-alpha-glucan branching enzyme